MGNLAIVSSYEESCGNASFTNILCRSITEMTDTKAQAIGLDLTLTQSLGRRERRAANEHIDSICQKLESFDAVNIQFEAGLYGAYHRDILFRLRKLLTANSKTFVTLHAPRILQPQSINMRGVIKTFLRQSIRQGLDTYATQTRIKRDLAFNRDVVQEVINAKAKIIVHTERSANNIKALFEDADVHVHPIKFVDHKTETSTTSQWKARLNVPLDAKLVGIFGFIGKYKGHESAIRAINELPEDYYLLIAGRQHPQAIVPHQEIDGYLASLLDLISTLDKKSRRSGNLRLVKRVLFLNELSHPDFLSLVASVDCCWLPYHEVGQDGSGVASIVFDLGQRIIASNSKTFDELLLLEPNYRCERVDIGNWLELAQRTLMVNEEYETSAFFTVSSQANLYSHLATQIADEV